MSENIQKYRYLSQILPDSTKKKLVLLTGARQTGKTTLVRTTYPDIPYINLDAPENREFLQSTPSAAWAHDVGNAVLDEVQKEPVVFEKIKYAYDENTISFSVLLGSSQILLLKKIRESLAGRIAIYELWPLLMRELLSTTETKPPLPLFDSLITGDTINSVLESVPARLPMEETLPGIKAEQYMLTWGGMPAILHLPDEEKKKWLRDYEYTYLERDLGDLARLDDLTPFRKFQKLSALRSGCLLNYSELARDAGISVDTSRRYLEYLNLSYQVILLQPYHRNLTSTIVKTPKLYWLDIGLLRQLCGWANITPGALYETMVVGETVKWIRTLQRECDISFYRTRSGLEVDLLLSTPHGVIGMEVKSRETAVSSDTRGLRACAETLGSEWLGGIVVYRGEKIKKLADTVWAVPSARLFT